MPLGIELNTSNFIRWRAATGIALADIATATLSDNPALYPNQALKRNINYFPKVIIGSEVSVYANLTTAATDLDYSDWACLYVDSYGNTSGSITLNQDDFGSGNFRWYFSDTPSASDLTDNKVYQFVIYNTSTMNVKYVSNCFKAVAASEAYKYGYYSYRNQSSLDNFNYTDLTSFRNKIALDTDLINEEPNLEYTDYPEITTGDVQNTKTYKRISITFLARQFDRESRRALESVLSCSDILINTNTVKRNEAPTWEPDAKSSQWDGPFKVWDQSYSEINLNGYNG